MIDFSQVTGILLGSSVVEQIANSQGVVLWKKAGDDPAANSYFYVEDASGSDNTLSINKNRASAPTIEVFKSSDGTNWESMGNTDTTDITATIPANGKLYLKCTANNWANDYGDNFNRIVPSRNFNVGGNILSLIYGDNFEGKTGFPTGSEYNLSNLFNSYYGTGTLNTKLRNANKLILPSTVNKGCYKNMFYECASLTTAPALPATTLADSCYNSMFYGCTALTTAPALPATILTEGCYGNMFNGCTSLTTAPALPATTLGRYCYNNMFNGCTALTTAPELPATTLIRSCYQSMFYRCSALTTAPELSATTVALECCRDMFNGCTSLTTAPELPATTLADNCYQNMFRGCANLNSVTIYATDISADRCLTDWLYGVSSTGEFYNLGSVTYPSGASGIPSGWTEHTSL